MLIKSQFRLLCLSSVCRRFNDCILGWREPVSFYTKEDLYYPSEYNRVDRRYEDERQDFNNIIAYFPQISSLNMELFNDRIAESLDELNPMLCLKKLHFELGLWSLFGFSEGTEKLFRAFPAIEELSISDLVRIGISENESSDIINFVPETVKKMTSFEENIILPSVPYS